MASWIKHPKDFYAGVMYASVGVGAILLARGYHMGTSVRMGPGYFPTVLGALLLLIGTISIVRAFTHTGEAIRPFFWKGLALVLGSTALFGILIRGAGLVPSLILLVVLSACASDKFRLRTALILAAVATIFSALVFVKGLGLPLSLIGPWLGGI